MPYELTLRSLHALMAVADTGSVRMAAEQLCITQPALSQRLARLSEVFGGAVVERRGRGIQLTERGRIVVAHARDAQRCLDSASTAVTDLTSLTRGRIRIGVLQSVNLHLIPAGLARMAAAHPGVHASVRELSGKQIEEGVASGDLDLGIGVSPAAYEDLNVTPLYAEHILWASARDPWPHAPLGVVPLTRACDIPLALLSREFTTRQLIDSRCVELDIALQPAVETNTISSLLELVRTRTFCTLLPYSALIGKRIAFTSLTSPELKRTVSILRRQSPIDSVASTAFIGILNSVVSDLAAQHADLEPARK